jgi:3-methyladenine DNA glycosylase AlkD
MQTVSSVLHENKDEKYADFQRKLIPNIPPETIIGVRTPILRKMAKQIAKDDSLCKEFMGECPHEFFEENQLHGFIISGMKDFDECITSLENFLPCIDNWATCDQTSPKVFTHHKDELMPHIVNWLSSEHTYTLRFGIGMLMQHYLKEDFKREYIGMVTGVKSGEYYVNMEIAWYMATALAFRWDDAVTFIENGCLDKWTHNKTIQKAIESYRIPGDRKDYLRTLKKRQ